MPEAETRLSAASEPDAALSSLHLLPVDSSIFKVALNLDLPPLSAPSSVPSAASSSPGTLSVHTPRRIILFCDGSG